MWPFLHIAEVSEILGLTAERVRKAVKCGVIVPACGAIWFDKVEIVGMVGTDRHDAARIAK